jgi:hypothetical protein
MSGRRHWPEQPRAGKHSQSQPQWRGATHHHCLRQRPKPALATCGPTLAGPGIVSSTAPRTVRHAAGRTGKGLDAKGPYGLTDEIAIPSADQYYPDLAITFREQLEWGAPTTA